MTLREAIQLKLNHQFEKKTVTTEASGDSKVYHYFETEIHGVFLQLAPDESKEDVWCGLLLNYPIKFYTQGSFESLIQSLEKGEWDDN